jgi:hypothetical protein
VNAASGDEFRSRAPAADRSYSIGGPQGWAEPNGAVSSGSRCQAPPANHHRPGGRLVLGPTALPLRTRGSASPGRRSGRGRPQSGTITCCERDGISNERRQRIDAPPIGSSADTTMEVTSSLEWEARPRNPASTEGSP